MEKWQRDMQHLDRWLAQPMGQELLRLQLPILQKHLKEFTEVSSKQYLLIFNGLHYHKIDLHHQHVVNIAGYQHPGVDVVASPVALPFAEESFDTIVLPYVFEAFSSIIPVIQECHRVLKPQGTLVIFGLNALSILRWQTMIDQAFKQIHFRNIENLQKELFLHGYDLLQQQKFSFTGLKTRASIGLDRVGRYLWPFLGNAFVLTMRKRVEVLTPIKPKMALPPVISVTNTRLANITSEREIIGKNS